MSDVALGSPSRVPCRRCGMETGRPCTDDGFAWRYCKERVADLRALLVSEFTPRVVTLADGLLLIDGKPQARPADLQTPMEQHAYAKRGGARHGRRRRP